jgi:mannose-6-phosphate isomerase-like protein (cupin superfamily)
MSQSGAFDISSTYLRLRPDASVEPLTVDNTFWQRISSGQLGDFHNEFLVAGGTYEKDWPMWEMHPNGDEVVYLLSGSATFVLEQPQGNVAVELSKPGEYVLVPKGTWHTAKVREPCRLLFITPGEGTQHRPATP